ncbi:MAG: segregation/condensation protein A [Anaerolineales bacterium]|nr:segregation/condensation protein A [Anaerolineales bacterium]
MAADAPYAVQLPVFEGPLDLLLELIERAELDITRVSLAQVTHQYLEYLRLVPAHDLADLAAFLVVAARLLQIKSEALLPRPPTREPGEEDPGDALARQLIAYKKYKQVAVLLAEREAAGLRTYLRVAPPPSVEPTLDARGLTLEALQRAMFDVLLEAARGPALDEVVRPPVVRIRDKIRLLLDCLRRDGRTTFRQMVAQAHTRLEIVVSFLASLELIKRQQVVVQQAELFGDIEVLPGTAWRPDQEPDLELDLELEE